MRRRAARRRRRETLTAMTGRRGRAPAIRRSELPALHFLEQAPGLRLFLFRTLPKGGVELRGTIALGRNYLLRVLLGQCCQPGILALGHPASEKFVRSERVR